MIYLFPILFLIIGYKIYDKPYSSKSGYTLWSIVFILLVLIIGLRYKVGGDTYNYIALPIDVWTSKSVEYKQQYQIGIKFPTLSPINIPGLEIVQEEYETESQRAINKTLRMFGEDNVKIE